MVADIDDAQQEMLMKTGRKVLPGLSRKSVVASYAGIRPATTERDYLFHLDANRKFLSVASIRSTGLTASLGIGRHASSLLQSVFDIETEPTKFVKATPFKNVSELIAEYKRRGDGTVDIPHLGKTFVTL